MNKTLLVGAVAVVALVISGAAYFRPPTLVEKETVREVVKELGAIPGNDLPSVVKFGGSPLIGLYKRGSIGTTTPCVFDVRNYASSTIIALGADIRGVPTTTGNSWKWYTGVGQTSTTTILAGKAVTATGTSVFATTTLITDSVVLDTGDNYLVLDFNGGSTPYMGMEGNTVECSAILLSPGMK